MNANVRVLNGDSALKPAGVAAQELAVAGTVVTPAALAAAVTHCWVSVKTYAVLCTLDGTDPAISGQVGIYLPVTSAPMLWNRAQVAAAKFIEAVGGNAGVVRFEPLY